MSKPVLFTSFRPLERAENMRAIYDAYDGEKVFVQTLDENYESEVLSGKYDLLVNDDFPKVSPGKCIVVWHAIQGGKMIGLNQPMPYHRKERANLITCLVASGTGTVHMYSRCAGISKDQILPLGMPRTDAYIGKHKGDGGTILAGKRSYLYVPTFRRFNEEPFPDINWRWLDNHLSDRELFAVKMHPTTQNFRLKQYRHIIQISGDEPSAAYLYDADVIISDYSSIIFDGYLLGKPAVLFEKESGYAWTRGMYLDYPDAYCSRYVTTEHDLLAMIRTADGLTDTEQSVLHQVADMCDGHACERVISLIHDMNGDDTHE